MSSTSNGPDLGSSYDCEPPSENDTPWQVTGNRLPPRQHASVAEYEIRLRVPFEFLHEEDEPPVDVAGALEIATCIVEKIAKELLPQIQHAVIATQGKGSKPPGENPKRSQENYRDE